MATVDCLATVDSMETMTAWQPATTRSTNAERTLITMRNWSCALFHLQDRWQPTPTYSLYQKYLYSLMFLRNSKLLLVNIKSTIIYIDWLCSHNVMMMFISILASLLRERKSLQLNVIFTHTWKAYYFWGISVIKWANWKQKLTFSVNTVGSHLITVINIL